MRDKKLTILLLLGSASSLNLSKEDELTSFMNEMNKDSPNMFDVSESKKSEEIDISSLTQAMKKGEPKQQEERPKVEETPKPEEKKPEEPLKSDDKKSTDKSKPFPGYIPIHY